MMTTGIITNNSPVEIDAKELTLFLADAFELIPQVSRKYVEISIIKDRAMREINKEFRGIDSTTDVLSFPFKAEEFEDDLKLGELLISGEQAEKQAKENSLPLIIEVKQLILHGLLHLCGYDHETDDGEMNSLELKLRDKLNINH